jgi:hypothetical protein
MPPRSASSSKQTPPVGGGAIPRVVIDLAPLLALGVLFISSDARLSFIDDEATTLNDAAQPLHTILAIFRSSAGAHRHLPLYDLLLHLWLALTGGAPALLRVPPMLLFLAGVWVLSRAALRIGGAQSATSMIWLACLWPFGFHYGRLENGYSFLFLLIAALIWAYLRYAAAPGGAAWALVCLLAVALIWTSYFGWILLALLGVEECMEWNRNGRSEHAAASRLAIAAAVLAVVSIPLWHSLLDSIRNVIVSHASVQAALFNAGFKVYVLLVSESVAPWYWKFGVPGMLAVLASLTLIVVAVHGQARRFFLYGALLVAALAMMGRLSSENLLLAAPWFLLAAAVAIGTTHTSVWRRVMAVSLAVVAGVGWYGVFARVYYATPIFIEPWGDLAVEAGSAVRQGGVVVGNDPSFFLYLTYALRLPQSTPWRFVGILPSLVQDQQVWGPDEWQAAGRPLPPAVLWVAGTPESASMDDAGNWLDHNCGDRTTRYLARDSSFVWRERFLHESAPSPWLIEVRQYSCGPNSTTAPPSAPPPAEPSH